MILRTRTIEIEGGQKVLISALKAKQVRQLMASFQDGTANNDLWPKQVICWSFNNIAEAAKEEGKPDVKTWTVEDVDEIDQLSILQLRESIFDLSGLRSVKQGEETAAETTANSPSSAAPSQS